MPRRATIPFPGSNHHGILLSHDEHALLSSAVAPFHGPALGRLLQRAETVDGGRRVDGLDGGLYALMEAVAVEANGFLKVEEENAGRTLRAPKRGGTAARLFAIYTKLDNQLS
jgi:hypothetical protein